MSPTAARAVHSVLILGPMQQRANGIVTSEARTVALKNIVQNIFDIITRSPEWSGPLYEVISPEDRRTAVLVPGILDLIEKSELIIIDLTDNKVNVAYETGIIHALGLPHIFLTASAEPPFYFRPSEHISHFTFTDRYDETLPAHRDLYERIRRFVMDSTASNIDAFTDNQLTQYYGLPIIDIAGPSGLAAGYFRNAVRRFIRDGGYLGAPCNITWTTRDKDQQDVRHTATLRIRHMVAVQPPGGLTDSYNSDLAEFTAKLASIGLRTQFATIPRRTGDFQDIRDFSGQLLVYADADADAVEFTDPAIVIEMPTTLYALQYSPRVRHLNRLKDKSGVIGARKQRLLEQMQRSFEENLRFQLGEEPDAGMRTLFHYTSLDRLPELLTSLGVGPR